MGGISHHPLTLFGEPCIIMLMKIPYISKFKNSLQKRKEIPQKLYFSQKYFLAKYHQWPIKCTGHLFQSKNFRVGACSDWVLNGTWLVIKKKQTKNLHFLCKAIAFFTKIQKKILPKFLSNLSQKSFFGGFNWVLNRTWVLIRNFSPMAWCLFGLAT